MFTLLKDRIHECIFNSYIDYLNNITKNNKMDAGVNDLTVGEDGGLYIIDGHKDLPNPSILEILIDDVFPDEYFKLSKFYKTLNKKEKEIYNQHFDYLMSHDEDVYGYENYIWSILNFVKNNFENKFYIHIYKISEAYMIEKISYKKIYEKYVQEIRKLVSKEKNAKLYSIIDKKNKKYQVKYGKINQSFTNINDLFEFIKVIKSV